MFRSEQGINPGSELQNYDDILRKQKVFHIVHQYEQ